MRPRPRDVADDCEPMLLAGEGFTIDADGTVDPQSAWACKSQHGARIDFIAPIHPLTDCWKYRAVK